ncbi:holo-ACP synthase [Petrocella sp. FN5]|uniref:holo-ACP synthase n=1 Tax=Petrocella sp. FN5 TaxID=3032002 RepID=UPI0023D9C1FD|nr:holo-ACP synthase [Petrocella sp. FN5]MDF1616548.1 holo-ACP synthase [Petrocella sp. FN5]
MIVGIGNDMIEIERILKAISRPKFLTRYFTKAELNLFRDRKMNPSTIAANFSAKEAVTKVFGTGFREFGLKDVEILRNELGRPYIKLYGQAKEIEKQMGIDKWHITVSHTKSMVSVVVLGEKYDCSKE